MVPCVWASLTEETPMCILTVKIVAMLSFPALTSCDDQDNPTPTRRV